MSLDDFEELEAGRDGIQQYDIERDDEGKALFVHSPTCPGYCDYACNEPDGWKQAEVIAAAEAADQRGRESSTDDGRNA